MPHKNADSRTMQRWRSMNDVVWRTHERHIPNWRKKDPTRVKVGTCLGRRSSSIYEYLCFNFLLSPHPGFIDEEAGERVGTASLLANNSLWVKEPWRMFILFINVQQVQFTTSRQICKRSFLSDLQSVSHNDYRYGLICNLNWRKTAQSTSSEQSELSRQRARFLQRPRAQHNPGMNF